MNQKDKKILKALNFFGDNSCERIALIKKEDIKMYRTFVPDDAEKILYKKRYVSDNIEDVDDPSHLLTELGSKEARELQELKNYDYLRITAIGSLIFSIIALLKSFAII